MSSCQLFHARSARPLAAMRAPSIRRQQIWCETLQLGTTKARPGAARPEICVRTRHLSALHRAPPPQRTNTVRLHFLGHNNPTKKAYCQLGDFGDFVFWQTFPNFSENAQKDIGKIDKSFFWKIR